MPIGSDDGDNVITVTLTDDDAWDGDPTDGTILDPGGPGFPHVVVCDFNGSPTSGSAPLTVVFSDESNQDVDTWEWDFDDDGQVDSTERNPSHTYQDAGSFSVRLVVSGPGGSDSVTRDDYVVVAPQGGIPVPALGRSGRILFVVLLAGAAVFVLRRMV